MINVLCICSINTYTTTDYKDLLYIFKKKNKNTVKMTLLEVFFKSIHFCEKYLNRSTVI